MIGRARFFHRALAVQVAAFEAAGWRRVARDWSCSAGELALMEWDGAGAPPSEVLPMRDLPHLGQTVRIWPAVGVRVQDGATGFGRFLAAEGREVVWDSYWHRRLLDGSVHLHEPAAPTRSDEKVKR